MKFFAFSFNDEKTVVSLEGIKIPKDITHLEFGINVTIENNIELFFDNMTGMIVFAHGLESKDVPYDLPRILSYLKEPDLKDNMLKSHNNFLAQGYILPDCDEKPKITFLKQNIFSSAKMNKTLVNFMEMFKLNDYFLSISYRGDFGNQTSSINSIVISPVNFIYPIAREEQIIDLSKLGIISLQNVPSASCIWNIEENRTRRWTTDTVLKFRIGKYGLGEYIPDTNVLILSNILCSNEYEWLEKFFDFLKKNYLKKSLFEKDKITIGCDPEFELFDSNGVLMVREDLNVDGRLQNKIGADGHGMQLELRPNPSTDPKDVVDDLINLFGSVAHLKVSTKGDQEPLGGHIHFGAPTGKALTKYTELVRVLDHFIGNHFHTLDGRARHGYGENGDIRYQPWGFEYRTPPAAIFTTKEIAYITLKLAKNLAETIVEKDIVADIKVSLDDLKQFLTEEEAIYYIEFPKNYSNLDSKDIIKYWREPQESPIKVVFHDLWDPDTKERFEQGLKDSICDAPVTLHLYGLKDTDGRNAGIDSSKPHPKAVYCNEGIAIGLIKIVRYGSNSTQIIRVIRNKLLKIIGTKFERTTQTLFPEEIIGSDYDPKTKHRIEPDLPDLMEDNF
ncbi:MAG: hypothetical protein PHW15_02780 [Patescibacteria group bacterium]|nr:hypothetical protein [Patescibacteria group bacterium]